MATREPRIRRATVCAWGDLSSGEVRISGWLVVWLGHIYSFALSWAGGAMAEFSENAASTLYSPMENACRAETLFGAATWPGPNTLCMSWHIKLYTFVMLYFYF
jgi:hypothetical protein